jgi:glycosyltransferase involved in cell wall biosynthesis
MSYRTAPERGREAAAPARGSLRPEVVLAAVDVLLAAVPEVARILAGDDTAPLRGRDWLRQIDRMLRARPDPRALLPHADRIAKLRRSPYWDFFLDAVAADARRAGEERLSERRLRSLWGTTPLINLAAAVRADRRLGIDAESLVFTTYRVTSDFTLNLSDHVAAAASAGSEMESAFYWLVLVWATLSYDIFFYFYDRGILPAAQFTGRLQMGINVEELALLRRADKRLYAIPYGADYRTRQRTISADPRFNFCMDCPEPGRFCFCNDDVWPSVFYTTASYATAVLATGLALGQLTGARRFDYIVVDTERLEPRYPNGAGGRKLNVLHVPNHPHFKGTAYLEAAIARLPGDAGLNFTSATGISNAEVLSLMRDADIVVDQLIGGHFGMTAFEAMALGKPVIVYIADWNAVAAPAECPVINANPDTIETVLSELASDPRRLPELGRRSRAYVERHYSVAALTERLRCLYTETTGWRGLFPLASSAGAPLMTRDPLRDTAEPAPLSGELAALHRSLAAVTRQRDDELRGRIDGARAALEALERTRRHDAEQRSAIASQLAESERQLLAARSAIEGLSGQLAAVQTQLAAALEARTDASRQRDAVDSRLGEDECRHVEGNTALSARLAQAEAALARVYGSRSWALTRPLRALGRIARAARHPWRTLRRSFPRTRAVLRRWFIAGFVWSARRATAFRLRWGRPRTLWGVTPILTLPLLAECDRRLGFRSRSLVYVTYYITRKFDINLEPAMRLLGRVSARLANRFPTYVLAWAMLRYDFCHYFLDRGVLAPAARMGINPKELDLIRRAGKRLYTYTYGADVRTRAATLRLGRYNFCVDCPQPPRFCVCIDAIGAATVAEVGRYATAMLAMGDMLTYVPGATELHFWPIDVARVSPASPDYRGDRPLRVLHAPNHTHFKGTRHLEAAVARLRAEGHAIELDLVQGVPNSEVMARMRAADIVAEQFIGGFHGYTALEGMALGKPVVSYVRDRRLLLAADECPLLDADPERLEAVLRACVTGAYDLAALGRQGRAYVEKYHSIDAVAVRLGRLYLATASLPARRARAVGQRIWRLERQLDAIAVPRAVARPMVPA